MRALSLEEQEEITALFASTSFQRFADSGVFRLSPLQEDEQSVSVPTPTPPAHLAPESAVPGLTHPAGTATGSLARPPEVVEHQSAGPLEIPETGATAKKAKSAKGKTE